MVLNVHRNHKAYEGRGEGGGRGMEVGGEGDYIPIATQWHCHHQNDSCIKVGNDESHFNVSVGSEWQKSEDSVHKPLTFLKRKESRSGIEPRSFRRLPA